MAVKKKFPEETVDSMLRRFKKEVVKSEILKDLRKKEYYVAPSEKRRLKSAEAQKRAKKNAAKNKPMY
jgi:small subunit ribosomal protein S21